MGDPGAARLRVHLVLLPLLLFVVIPAFVLKENAEDLADFDPRAFLWLGLVALLASLLLLVVDFALRGVTRSHLFSGALEYLAFFVVLTGFALPASKGSGMRDPWLLEIDTVHVTVAAVLALAMSLASSSGWRRPLQTAVVVFVLLNAALCVPALRSLVPGSGVEDGGIYRLSSERNILVLSFDGVSGSAVREVLEQHPEVQGGLPGFAFFHRVASSSPATSASTAASLYGNRDFKKARRTRRRLWHHAPHRLLTNYLDANGFDVSTYGAYNRGFADRDRRHDALAPRPPASILTLLNYSLARALTRFAVVRTEQARRLDEWAVATLSPLGAAERGVMRRLSSSHSPEWKRKRLTPTILDFSEYVRRLHVGTDRPVAHFAHFTYTHFPVEFDRDCRFMGDDRDWFEARQNRMGVVEETRCVLKQAARFVAALEALGVLERSLVVLKSDHGKPWQYGAPGSMEAATIRGHRRWGYGRYRPFLAIKDFGRGHPGVRHDLHPVMLDDLARTLCQNAGIGKDCGFYPGYDLLGTDLSGMEHAEATLFVVRSPRSTHEYRTHEGITVTRGPDVVASLCAALSREPGAPDVACDGG